MRRRAGIVLTATACLLGGAVAAGTAGGSGAHARSRRQPPTTIMYGASVRATGQLIVTFTAAPATCARTHQCAVRSGTLRWVPPAMGGLVGIEASSGGLRGYLDLQGPARPPSGATVTRGGADVCTDAPVSDDAELPVAGAGRGAVRFALYAPRITAPSFGPPLTPLAQAFDFIALGQQPQEPEPTRCGGPLPGDFLPRLPGRRVLLARLEHGPTDVDLSGSAAFAAGGLAGTVRSTIVIHVGRLRASRTSTRPPRGDVRTLYVHYRITRVTGFVGVALAGDPTGCDALDACGLTGSLHVRPGPAHGQLEIIAYDSPGTGSRTLRQAVGLAPGPPPPGVQVGGMGSWTGASGSVSAKLARNGAPACQDAAGLPVGGIEIRVNGRRATAIFGAGDGMQLETPNRDLLRTRCPGPTLFDLGAAPGLAWTSFPASWLGHRTLTLHLTHGVTVGGSGLTVGGSGLTWRSTPHLTVVLRRTTAAELMVPSWEFQT